MMYTEKFDRLRHMEDIISWLSTRQSYIPSTYEIPKIGIVVYERGTPVAAGFLRSCEGNIAVFDGLVTDPNAESSQRNQCLDLLVSQLIKTAKELELKGIIAWSKDEFTLLRSYRHGFKKLPETVIALDLSTQETLK